MCKKKRAKPLFLNYEHLNYLKKPETLLSSTNGVEFIVTKMNQTHIGSIPGVGYHAKCPP